MCGSTKEVDVFGLLFFAIPLVLITIVIVVAMVAPGESERTVQRCKDVCYGQRIVSCGTEVTCAPIASSRSE